MAIERKVDALGRVVIPSEIRDYIGIEEGDMLSITREDEKIIVAKYNERKTAKEIKERLESKKKSNTEYYSGYKDALKWVLNEK